MPLARVGHIDFMNVLPLSSYYEEAEEITIVKGTPAELNARIAAGELDLSNVSSILYARQAQRLFLLPDICVASVGAVQSILLFSRVPMEDLGGRVVALTAKSATSHCLLKILLREKCSSAPIYSEMRLDWRAVVPEAAEAALFIGDDALRLFHAKPQGFFCYDLGEAWKELTNLPMIYGLWVAQRAFAEESPDVLRVIFERLRGELLSIERRNHAIRRAAGTSGFTIAQLESYLGGDAIRWNMTEDRLAGLELFYRLSAEAGLLDSVPQICFAKDLGAGRVV